MERNRAVAFVLVIGTSLLGLTVLFPMFLPAQATEINCTDRIDNDNDGYTDDDDSDCGIIPPPPPPPSNETNCTDGIDNDKDGHIDSADSDCTSPPPPPSCDAWYHPDVTGCVPDLPSYGMTLQNLGLNTAMPDAFYEGGRWRIEIVNPFYLKSVPPAPNTVTYVIRWVGPDGVIDQDSITQFLCIRACTVHEDISDEADASGTNGKYGQWTVYIYATNTQVLYREDYQLLNNEFVADVNGKTFQYIGSDTFTATSEQHSLLKLLCLTFSLCD